MCMCKYAMVMCQQNGGLCSCKDNMETCEKASLEIGQHITFKQCIEIYDQHSEGVAERKAHVKNSVRESLTLLGLNENSSVDEMSYRKFRQLITILESKVTDGRPLSKYTIAGRVLDFRAVMSQKLRDYYEDLGFARPIFDIPKYHVPKKKVKVMTLEQDCLVDNWMRQLSVSTDPLEQRAFVALWFERLFGMRPGDINRLTWDCIHIEGSIVKLIYKPHKTMKCPGRDDPIIVHPKLWSWVAPFYVPGGLLLPRMRSARKALSRNRAVWDFINKWYREHGICDDARSGKASYINRRQRITEAFNKDGWRGAAAIGKNTPRVQMEHYVAIGEYAA